MRVALDSTALTLSSGGLTRYVTELANALTEDEVILMSDQIERPKSWLERRWWLYGARQALKRNRADIFHGANFAVPYFPPCATVLSLHDLSPWMDSAWHTGASRVRRHTPWMLRRATMVLTLSEAVRRAAIERFRIKPERIAAVPLAASAQFHPTPGRNAGTPYFLFVGTLEPRKNILFLLDAWRRFRRTQPIDLVLAGRRRADFPVLTPEPGLRILGEVADADLPGLYSNAQAVIYPSLYEGFGLPVLEAMQCGALVITSRDPAITEIAKDAALQVATPAEMMDAFRASCEPELRLQYRELALARAARYSWARTASLTREIYLEAIRRYAHS